MRLASYQLLAGWTHEYNGCPLRSMIGTSLPADRADITPMTCPALPRTLFNTYTYAHQGTGTSLAALTALVVDVSNFWYSLTSGKPRQAALFALICQWYVRKCVLRHGEDLVSVVAPSHITVVSWVFVFDGCCYYCITTDYTIPFTEIKHKIDISFDDQWRLQIMDLTCIKVVAHCTVAITTYCNFENRYIEDFFIQNPVVIIRKEQLVLRRLLHTRSLEFAADWIK